MFRKGQRSALKTNDCHFTLRNKLIEEGGREAPNENDIPDKECCISIAHDWIHMGLSLAGRRREIMWSLTRILLNRRKKGALLCMERAGEQPKRSMTSLAQTELSLLYLQHDQTASKALGPITKSVVAQQLKTIHRATLVAKAQQDVAKKPKDAKKPKNGKKVKQQSVSGLVKLVEQKWTQ